MAVGGISLQAKSSNFMAGLEAQMDCSMYVLRKSIESA